MGVSITKPTGWVTEEFLVREKDYGDWMEVVVSTQGSAIRLKINSSFEAMGYTWGSCGENVDWRTWLLDTDFQYFMKKMFGYGYRQFSYEKTVQNLREAAMEMLDFDELDEVMEIFDELDENMGEHEMLNWIEGHLDVFGYDDWWHLLCREDRPDLRSFWTELWRPFIEGVQ
jgi:hypothetical protein